MHIGSHPPISGFLSGAGRHRAVLAAARPMTRSAMLRRSIICSATLPCLAEPIDAANVRAASCPRDFSVLVGIERRDVAVAQRVQPHHFKELRHDRYLVGAMDGIDIGIGGLAAQFGVDEARVVVTAD